MLDKAKDKQAGHSCQECPSEQDDELPKIKVRLVLFYDGTLNNRSNVRMGVDYREKQEKYRTKEVKSRLEGSYGNGLTNVVRMAEGMSHRSDGFDITLPHYTEGIGTEDLQDDSVFPGAALGTGDTGVDKKAERGLSLGINKMISAIKGDFPNHIVEEFAIDTFGFSRGAAAARYCVHLALKDKKLNIKKVVADSGIEILSSEAIFVGLYDTVASYGIKHTNDTSDLKLDAVKAAGMVVQLAAGDEHRENFRLTNVKLSGSRGHDIYLPGVHSDIGGGYIDGDEKRDFEVAQTFSVSSWINKSENLKFIRDEIDWHVDRGWLTRGHFLDMRKSEKERKAIEPGQGGLPDGDDALYDATKDSMKLRLRVNRNQPSAKYDRIPLQIMVNWAKKNGLVFFLATMKYSYKEDPFIRKVYEEKLKPYEGGKARENFWINNTSEDWLKTLRMDYFHMSAFYGASMGAHDPQYKNGKRERKIQKG